MKRGDFSDVSSRSPDDAILTTSQITQHSSAQAGKPDISESNDPGLSQIPFFTTKACFRTLDPGSVQSLPIPKDISYKCPFIVETWEKDGLQGLSFLHGMCLLS